MSAGNDWTDELATVLLGVARGDFSGRMTRSGKRDHTDAIAFLINSTAQEVDRLFHEVERERDFIRAVLESVPDSLFVIDA